MLLGWPNSRRYSMTSLLLWGGFLAALVAMQFASARGWPLGVQIVLALIPAATVVAQFRLAWALVDAQDEVVRAVLARRLMLAAAATITLAVAFAPLQGLLSLPQLPVWLIYPLFWGMLGVLSSFDRDSRP